MDLPQRLHGLNSGFLCAFVPLCENGFEFLLSWSEQLRFLVLKRCVVASSREAGFDTNYLKTTKERHHEQNLSSDLEQRQERLGGRRRNRQKPRRHPFFHNRLGGIDGSR